MKLQWDWQKNVEKAAPNVVHMIGDQTVYTSDTLDARLSTPVFSDCITMIAFVESTSASDNDINENDIHRQTIVTGTFDANTKTISILQRIPVQPDFAGYLCFDESNNVSVVNCYNP